ncbi:MAG: META domain-containing protein [Woeseiaceae bacterium]
MKINNLLLILALILCSVACAPTDSGGATAKTVAERDEGDSKPDVSLTNTYWKLVALNGGAVEPGEGKELHMILKGDDRVGGYSGCNQFMGSVVVSGDGLSFGPIAGTRRMCEGSMDQENAFLQALESAHRFSISGEDLAVENANGEITMRFVAVYLQ